MKALIKPSTDPAEFEIYPESAWHKWIDKETGAPLTDENYGYAICYNFPEEDVDFAEMDDFSITVEEREVESVGGDEPKTVIFKIAEYHPRPRPESTDSTDSITY